MIPWFVRWGELPEGLKPRSPTRTEREEPLHLTFVIEGQDGLVYRTESVEVEDFVLAWAAHASDEELVDVLRVALRCGLDGVTEELLRGIFEFDDRRRRVEHIPRDVMADLLASENGTLREQAMLALSRLEKRKQQRPSRLRR